MARAVILMLALIFVFSLVQERAIYPAFYDGGEYVKVAQTLPRAVADAPFCYRILTPALSRLLPFGHDLNFQIVNTLAFLAFGILLYKYTGSLLSILIFAIPYHTPLRLLFYYPCLVDAMFYLSVMAALVLLKRDQVNMFIFVVLSFFAVLNREIGIIIPAMFFIKRRNIVPLVFGAVALALTRGLGTATNDFTFSTAIVKSLNMSMGQYGNALFYGLTPLIVFADWKFRNYEILYLAFVILLSIIGGVNTIRFIFWAAPVFIPSIVRGLSRYKSDVQTILITITAMLVCLKYNQWGGWHIQCNPADYAKLFVNALIFGGFIVFRMFGKEQP